MTSGRWATPAAGAVVWALVAVAAAAGAGPSLIEVVLLLGPLVLVPLGLPLTRPPGGDGRAHALAERLALPGALLATAAVLVPRGAVLGGVLAGGWFVVALLVATPAAIGWLRSPAFLAEPLARTAALVFLAVGATWLVIDRLGLQPVGLDRDIVTLTAVHFHVAGFATSTIAARTVAVTGPAALRTSAAAVAGIVLGPAMVAVGFAAFRPLQLAGAVVLTGGIYLLAWLLVRHARPDHAAARRLLVLAAVVVIAPMVLAVQWAAGSVLGTPALGIPTMARTHGLANAFGFALPGLVAWSLVAGQPAD
ncbi:MAG: YndJ family protein [Actinobacteria bacterium]|nr:YndJ family protein [Actinomycetota bacterium]